MIQDSDELTVRQAADLLGKTSTAIYDFVKDGRLVPIRVEQKPKKVKRFFRRSDVEALRSSAQQ